jgi:ribonuclease J
MPLYDANHEDFPRGTQQRPTHELIAEKVLPDVAALYADDPAAPAFAAIILTHAHLDHYGLAHHAHPDIPVYGSRGTIALLEVARVFFPDAALPGDLRELPEDGPLLIGSLAITAIPVDHAAPDSRALFVEADGQRLLYSGDLRAHGRTGYRFDALLRDTRLHGIDWLLLEGTTLGASAGSHGLRSEQDVEESLVMIARRDTDKLLGVIAPGQNLDRLVSCFRAAKRSGRLLVVDPYQAFVLTTLAPLSTSIPQFTWDLVRVCFAPHQVERLKNAGLMQLVWDMRSAAKVSTDTLAENPGAYLMCARAGFGMTKVFDKIGPGRVSLVWSQWSGYWKRTGCPIREWSERTGVAARFIHSGGHAWPEDLKRLAEALQPEQMVIVHTEGGAGTMFASPPCLSSDSV